MPSILSDLRYAARELRRRPGFALTAIVSLALGIGATSAVFSVVYGVLINPFPYVGAERIMQISLRDPAGRLRGAGMTGDQILQLRQARTVESVVAEDGWNLTTTDGNIPEDVSASYISPNAPNHWGTPALLGRWLVPADAPPGQDPERVVVLGYQFWQRYYSGDPTAVGRTIQLVRKDYQIVGVMPPRFRWREADIYVPLKTSFEPNIYYGTTLKLKPGVTIAEANAELQPILQEFAKQTPTRYPDTFRVNLRSIVELFARPMGPKLYLLLGAVASLLLVGCANVSILLLVRGTHRQQELAVRAALGAGRRRIVQQLLTEALAIAVVGAALGVFIAWRGLGLIVAWVPTNSFAAESVIEMNVPVLVFSTALALITAIVFGVWPALQLSRPDLGRVAQASTRRVHGSAQGRRLHRVMVAVQVALTLLMLTAAGAAGQRLLTACHCGSGVRPAEHDVAPDSGSRRHLQDVEGTIRVLRATPRCRCCHAAGRLRRHLDQRDATGERRRHDYRDPWRQLARKNRSCARTTSARSISPCSTFRSRRDGCGIKTTPREERQSPSSIRRWPNSSGRTGTRLDVR